MYNTSSMNSLSFGDAITTGWTKPFVCLFSNGHRDGVEENKTWKRITQLWFRKKRKEIHCRKLAAFMIIYFVWWVSSSDWHMNKLFHQPVALEPLECCKRSPNSDYTDRSYHDIWINKDISIIIIIINFCFQYFCVFQTQWNEKIKIWQLPDQVWRAKKFNNQMLFVDRDVDLGFLDLFVDLSRKDIRLQIHQDGRFCVTCGRRQQGRGR